MHTPVPLFPINLATEKRRAKLNTQKQYTFRISVYLLSATIFTSLMVVWDFYYAFTQTQFWKLICYKQKQIPVIIHCNFLLLICQKTFHD